MNVTVTEPITSGFVTVWPPGLAQPSTSNLNFVSGLTVPNLVIVPVGINGTVSLATSSPTHLVADVLGWYGPAT